MRYFIPIVSILFLMQNTFAQVKVTRICFLAKNKKLANWSCLDQIASKNDSVAEATINTLLRPIGLRNRYVMRECDEIQSFAAFVSDKSRIRYIIYNKSMIDSIADPVNRHWDQISIYLHELAHHLNGDTSSPDDENSLQMELDADEFSGTRMAFLKATLVQAQRYLTLIESPPCDDEENSTHPCLKKRMEAVARGWYFGMGLEKFYKAVSSKQFNALISDKDQKVNNYLKSESFFEYDHCIRGFDCKCKVDLKELNLNIDLEKHKSSLRLKLIDNGGNKCNHQLDTTIFIEGSFEKHELLLPEVKFTIKFPMYEYYQSLRFEGVFDKSGILTGKLISPNEHGASWSRDPNERGAQLIAEIKLQNVISGFK
jgi:hypothetical protein